EWMRTEASPPRSLTRETSGTSPRVSRTTYKAWMRKMNTSLSLTMATLRRLGEFNTLIQITVFIMLTKCYRTTFMVDDWLAHTPKDILAKNFGVDPSVFEKVPSKFPYILNGTVSEDLEKEPEGTLKGNSSYVYHTYDHPSEPVPGQGGTF